MNKLAQLCRTVVEAPPRTQRELADEMGVSVGGANTLIKQASTKGYIQRREGVYHLTSAGLQYLEQFKVDNAIILAAGFGSRLVPFTFEAPKGLLKVKDEVMLNRQIEQLLEVGINEIVVVVGYLAEKFEYLIDTYGVKLIFNPEYATKNNIESLYLARAYLKNSYILVADHWIENNIFHTYEPESWMSCIYLEGTSEEWRVATGAYDRITRIEIGVTNDWALVGPCYFTKEFSVKYQELLEDYHTRPGTADYYWEHIVKENIKTLPIYINRQSSKNVYEFESLEDLRAYDPSYVKDTDNKVLSVISQVFSVPQSHIAKIRPMNDGMTNRSFVFEIAGESYVYRQPGVGTDMLISRSNEKRSYELTKHLNITDDLIYFDGDSGVKITRYYHANTGDPYNDKEVKLMMEMLRSIHAANIQAEFSFDIGERIDFYEALANERNSILFEDYTKVRACADELLAFRDALDIPERLCHIDYVFTNVLILSDHTIRVIDWEYAGMADPIIDVAMFSLYAYYSKEQIDRAFYHYLGRFPQRSEEARLYLYVALAGLLWSIWAEYKQGLGDDFGDYALEMYRYMKNYYRLLKEGDYLSKVE